MPRKSPRSRKKPDRTARVPGPGRPRSKPGQGRNAVRANARGAAEARAGTRPEHRAGSRRPAGARGAAGKRTVRAIRPGARPPAPGLARKRRPVGRATVPRRGRFKPPDRERVEAILAILERLYPDAHTALDHQNAFQLLIATILSAQCTDERVNLVTPGLFARYPDARAMAGAEREDLEAMIRSTGFFRNKTRSIQSCSADLVARHGGQVPRTLEELTALQGVGRKTANVVLGNCFGIPGLVVDTHVGRLARRLGFTREVDAVKVEFALMEIVPRGKWTLFSHWLILHGRRICIARRPRCSICPLLPHCPRVGVASSQ